MYIFDLDGTIANLIHRRHFVEMKNEGDKKDWDAFYVACVDDTPILPIINLMYKIDTAGGSIAILSGRSDIVKEETIKWLRTYAVPYDHLIMRPHGDYTPDQILKKQMLEQLNGQYKMGVEIDMVFDDRDRVVKMWREAGYICCQVAEGDF